MTQPTTTISGTVYWQEGKERVQGAVIQATEVKDATDKSSPAQHHAFSDDDGDFIFKPLPPGKWSLVAMHNKGMPGKPKEVPLSSTDNTTDVELKLPRLNAHNAVAGGVFFVALLIALAILAGVYIRLHTGGDRDLETIYPVLSVELDAALQQVDDSTVPVGENDELADTVQSIRGIVGVISSTSEIAGMPLVMAHLDDLEQSISTEDEESVKIKLTALERALDGESLRDFFWTTEPWRFVEVLLWGLAGVLISLLITTGSYMRWNRFYAQGIWLHVAQIISVPLMALVFVFLISLVTLTITLNENELHLDLSDPRILAAVSFLIGSQPWALWGFLQEASGRITGADS